MPLLRTNTLGPERRNPCTHMTMTRLYDPHGSFKCSLCHKHPNIGWLYRCTQDTGGFLPESDFTDEPALPRGRALGQEVTSHSLSSPIIKAIGEGQYTPQEVKKVIEQKEMVRDLVLSPLEPDESRPATASTFTTASTSSSTDDHGTFSTLPQSTTFSTNSSTELDEEIKAAYDWKELQKVWMSEPSIPPPAPRPKPSAPADPLPQQHRLPCVQLCSFKICPTCRPTYRERAYQSLEEVLNSPIELPPIWELQNRRVSDSRIVAGIGLPKLSQSRFYAQTNPATLQSIHSIPGIISDHRDAEDEYQCTREAYLTGASTETYPHRNNCSPATGTRDNFRQTVRKALARARLEDSASTNPNTNNSESGESQDQPSRSSIFRRRRSDTPTLSFAEAHGGRVVDTSSLQDSVMLMLATNTPLPHTPTMAGYQLGRGIGHRRVSDPLGDDGPCLQGVDVIRQI
ncbi:uncharacterized protein Z519_08502 [Cladophialophora bantiana CBS 173.52]|uniref:Uncharacterized protein n=1 Tax=Cladophialophora bantiana (strain ATCC 10958 / CBS 173.52 / CDC B-1940 / NIH 8579) TaxID=1442370 RepID=A0A0D2I1D7_CLAB1|nr:uncharacterized protein Z519_08502 [Cladophialophora bantiana CBS 173.52]KIW90719.1 hypothetical protein Z519_08502 [Cladophialophora bantiana CBS 173.52]